MPNNNKSRGNTLEREVVKLCEQYGLNAKRAYGSNGEALGQDRRVDVLIENDLKVQCKRMKYLPKTTFKELATMMEEDIVDICVFREDRDKKNPNKLQGKPYVMLGLDKFLKLCCGLQDFN